IPIAPLDQRIDALGFRNSLALAGQRIEQRRIMCRAPPQQKRIEIELDRNAIELDRALDGLSSDRDQTLLIGIAEGEHIRSDGIAQELSCDSGRVDEMAAPRLQLRFDER